MISASTAFIFGGREYRTLTQYSDGSDSITFMFDAQGSAYGFYYNDTAYFYVKNIQGDVIALTDSDGDIIGTYTYDGWQAE